MRATRQKARERHHLLAISGAIALVVAGAVCAMWIGTFSSTKQPMPLSVSNDFRGAIITGESDGTGCSLQVIDNRTGRTTRSQQSCETATYDSYGVPVPTGTIHRLDAISKSFRGP